MCCLLKTNSTDADAEYSILAGSFTFCASILSIFFTLFCPWSGPLWRQVDSF